MEIIMRRTQRQGGAFGGKVIFIVTIRAQYTEEERASINRYSLGGEVVYSSAAARQYAERAATVAPNLKGFGYLALAKMNLNITVASLQQGHTLEFKDLGELLECEQAIVDACQNVKRYLEAAATFNGTDIVVSFDDEAA